MTAFFSIESIKALSEKFKLSDTFVGAVFLSIGTSFPEFINSIVSGFKDRISTTNLDNSIKSFYNVTGANIWQLIFLLVVIAIIAVSCFFKKKDADLDAIVHIFWKDSFVSWKLVFVDTLFLLAIFGFPNFFSGFIFKGFNLVSLVFLFIWFFYLQYAYKQKKIEKPDIRHNCFSQLNKTTLILVTIFLWILFGSFAYGNFYISSQFGLSNSAAFGVILSFITSSPEFSVLFFLFRKKEYRIAVGGFFGSSLFNLILPVFTNLISRNSIFGNNSENNKLLLWLLFNICLLILFLFSFWRRKEGRKFVMVSNGIILFCVYILVNVFFDVIIASNT